MIPHINDSLPLDKANLIAFFLESLLHGVSTVLFIMTIYVLFRCKQERLNKRLLATSTAMMLFGTLHLIVDLIRIFQGFIVERDSIGGSVMYFARLYEWSQLLKTAIFVIQTVLADSFAVSILVNLLWRSSLDSLVSLYIDLPLLGCVEPLMGCYPSSSLGRWYFK